jgi:hypothetical protein
MTVMSHRRAVERWKVKNREYYLVQKRFLAHRPEYLAHRRRCYHLRQAMVRTHHSAMEKEEEENDEPASCNPTDGRRCDCSKCDPTTPS